MLGKYSYLALKWCLKSGSYIHAIPYEWCETQQKLVVRKQLSRFHLLKTLHFLHMSYLIVSFIHQRFTAGDTKDYTKNAMLHATMLSIFITTNLFTINYMTFQKETASFVNSLLHFNRKHKGLVMDKKPTVDFFGLLLLQLVISAMVTGFLFPCLFVFSPTKPHYAYSMIPATYRNWLIMIPFALNEYAQATHATFSSYFYGFTCLTTERSLNYWLQYLIEHSSDRFFCKRQIIGDLLLYRSIQLLQATQNTACRWVVFPTFYGCLLLLMVFFGYSSIRMYSVLPLFIYIIMPGIFVILLVFCLLLHHSSSDLHKRSSQFIQMQAHRKRCPELRRMVRSLRPFRVQVGATYYITRGTLIKFIHVVVNNTATALLTLH